CFLRPLRPPPRATLFPYTTLFRSARGSRRAANTHRHRRFHVAERRRRAGAGSARRLSPAAAWTRFHGGRQLSGGDRRTPPSRGRSEEHTSELQSRENLVCRLLLEK